MRPAIPIPRLVPSAQFKHLSDTPDREWIVRAAARITADPEDDGAIAEMLWAAIYLPLIHPAFGIINVGPDEHRELKTIHDVFHRVMGIK